MYKKITPKERVTRVVNSQHSIDNYLTKETTENISLAISKLNGELKLSKIPSERVYYFIKANAEFNIEGEIVFVNVRRSWRISKIYKEKFYRYGN